MKIGRVLETRIPAVSNPKAQLVDCDIKKLYHKISLTWPNNHPDSPDT